MVHKVSKARQEAAKKNPAFQAWRRAVKVVKNKKGLQGEMVLLKGAFLKAVRTEYKKQLKQKS